MIPKEWLQYIPKPPGLSAGKEWHVFISYRSTNRPWALSLYDVLTDLGYKVFLDQYVLKAGDNIVKRLEEGLEKSQAWILIWSAAQSDSTWVAREYNALSTKAIHDSSFVFVPVLLDQSRLPAFASNRIFIDFSDYPDGPNGGNLIRLLYAISGITLTPEVLRFISRQEEDAKDQAARINAAIRNNNPERLKQMFEKGGSAWEISATLGCNAAEGLIRLRRYDDALYILETIGTKFKRSLRPKQLKAKVLSRRGEKGDIEQAQDILGEMYTMNQVDSETLSLYGRTWMDRYTQSGDINDLIQSRDLYAEAFEKSPDDYYAGINAASKSVLIGKEEDIQKAEKYAKQVQQITGIQPVQNDYWKTATIAEIFLLQKKYKEAAEIYSRAIAMARTEIGSHESIYRQAIELMNRLKPTDQEREMIESVFKYLSQIVSKRRIKVFISYSHKDINYVDEFLEQLSAIEQIGRIELLLDRKISVGEKWTEKLDQFIHEADIIIILVSADSLASDSVNKEIQIATEQFNKEISLVIPVILSPCDWKSSALEKLGFISFDKTTTPLHEGRLWYENFLRDFETILNELSESWFPKIKTELSKRTGNLDLSECGLQGIPWFVTIMSWLSSLKLAKNLIPEVKRLKMLYQLRSLDLSNNDIDDIEGIEHLAKLTFLDLSYNKILYCRSLAANSELTDLFLGNNVIRKIPDLSGLPQLQKLDLPYNQIELISGIDGLLNLTYLNLSGNQVKKIGGMQKLPALFDLHLSNNRIERIEGLDTLSNLEYLDLYSNQIPVIEGLEKNRKLKSLGLSSNKLTSLTNISHLEELRTIYIAHNNIEDISELRTLKNLKRAVLTNNKIRDLFPIKEFIEADIPVKMEHSFNHEESGFFVKENPIEYPPVEVLIQGKDAILRNFRQQEEALQEELKPYQSNDIKLILIGNANVGKTHIATYIKSQKKSLPLNNASTHGMVNSFAKYNAGSPVKIRILDFGGQEYYHDTHHLFFTNDTIYLLLWEKNTNKFGLQTEKRFTVKTGQVEDETNAIFPVAYWLDAVNYFINRRQVEQKKSPLANADSVKNLTIDPSVILVETKRDKKGETLLDTSTITPYKEIIHSQVAISLYRDEQNNIISIGTDSLFDSLNDLIGSMFEKKWSGYYRLIVNFFENIESDTSVALLKEIKAEALILNLQECLVLFDKIISSSKYKYKFDEENALDLCRFLANRGYILFFDNTKICLHPEGLTKEIYGILSRDDVKGGIIPKVTILADKSSRIGDVLSIMQDFKLLIPQPDGQSFIAPQLLPENVTSQLSLFLEAFKPAVIRFSITGYIHKNIIQELFFSFKEKLIKEDTQNYIWKNGFIAKIEGELYKINIDSRENSRLIEVQYLVNFNPKLLNEISDEIAKVLGIRPYSKEVSLDGNFFIPLDIIRKNVVLSQFVHDGKLLRVADYKDFLNAEVRDYAMKKLFISYSSKNTAFMRRFVTHLEPLRRNGMINFWHDRMIEPGTKWDDAIKKELAVSDIVIFLLSPDFIATDYIFEVEIPQALEQFKSQPNKLFFVELQDCGWEQTILSNYQQTTDPAMDNKGVIIISDPQNDAQWKKVIVGLKNKLEPST